MLSMPFNSSTPVLWYNVDAFKKAGLDPDKPPKTWPEVAEYSKKLVAAGYGGGFSTAWISWIHLENFSAWHNIPFGTKSNGFDGLDTEFVYNSPLHVKHIQQLADWQKIKFSFMVVAATWVIPNLKPLRLRCTLNLQQAMPGSKRTASLNSAPACCPTGPRQPERPKTPSSAAPVFGCCKDIRPKSTKGWQRFSPIFHPPRSRLNGIRIPVTYPSPRPPTT